MEGAECATAALRNLADYHEFRRAWQADGAPPSESTLPHSGRLPSGILPTQAAFRLCDSYGIPVLPTVLTQTAGEAEAAALQLGFPVALKIESAEITHKSDVGGVALGLSSAAEVREACARMHRQVAARAPTAKIDGVIVQSMATQGVEMILGIKRDPLFGPVVLCGFGGVLVEVLKDVAIGIPPLSKEQARDMIGRLRGFAILGGVRGKPPADQDALCDSVVAVSRLAVSLGDQLQGLDINPLIVRPKGVVAVDALIQIK
jgi:acyl-CoA synthetase (NDP forming)